MGIRRLKRRWFYKKENVLKLLVLRMEEASKGGQKLIREREDIIYSGTSLSLDD